MDRFALAGSLRAANARVVAGQWALLEQRAQIRELEQCGLDASTAKALLRVYERSDAKTLSRALQEMSIFDRNRLYHALATTAADKPAPVHYDDRDFFDADNDIYLRQAA